MSASFRWPLAVSTFTLADKLRISTWLCSQDRYTMGAKVAELEARFSEFSGMHALMVANGSVANQLVFELWKVKNPGVKPVVICPAVTWISSISPALMAGMDVRFVDVNLDDFAFDYARLDQAVAGEVARGRRVIIWPTALIGFAPDMARIHQIAEDYGAEVFLDSCENTFSQFTHIDQLIWKRKQSILASAAMTTTSLYTSHQVCSLEGGFVFFRDRADYDLGRLFRNHGLTRSLEPDHPLRVRIQKDHPDVDPQFLFALAGTNLRPTDVHAMFGLADFKRIDESIAHRNEVYRAFHAGLDDTLYYLPPLSDTHVGFCLPIFARDASLLPAIKRGLTAAGIEVRPIIGGNLLHQPALKGHGRPQDFPNAEWIHLHGCYAGLHKGVTVEMVDELTAALNDGAHALGRAA